MYAAGIRWALSLALAAGSVVSGCGGGAGVGEDCDTRGSTDECEAGAVCDEEMGAVICLRICDNDGDCAGDEACNGVSGTNIKACHSKTKSP